LWKSRTFPQRIPEGPAAGDRARFPSSDKSFIEDPIEFRKNQSRPQGLQLSRQRPGAVSPDPLSADFAVHRKSAAGIAGTANLRA